MKNCMNIYVVMHKIVDLSNLNLDNIYQRLLVGKKECRNNDIVLDSTGDNISNKNKYYCELTGLYWMWKNDNSDYIGLCHYRRFFRKDKNIINRKDILDILSKNDIILPPRWYTTKTVYQMYDEKHLINDLDTCRDIISDKFSEYLSSFDKVINGNYIHTLNMFIAKKDIINEYCAWLFSIFDELEKRIDTSDRDDYQKRVYGFLSERLFNVWIEKKQLKTYICPIINTEMKNFDILKSKIVGYITKARLVLR